VKGELDERDMKVFFNIQLVGFRSWEGGEGGLQLAISFQTTKPVRKWEAFSSLMFGNLVCLSPRGRFHQVRHFRGSVFITGLKILAIIWSAVWRHQNC
jgi:hypothetical protein